MSGYEPRKPCWRLWPLQPCERLMLLGVGKRQARARRRQRLKRDSGKPPA